MPTKKCRRCGLEKGEAAFCRSARNNDGLQSYCKLCKNAVNSERRKRIGKSVLARCEKYRLSIAEVHSLLMVPQCQSCGAALPSSHSMKFDHCHVGGHLRGVLCHLCNVACAGTSDEVIARAHFIIDYCLRDKERNEQARAG